MATSRLIFALLCALPQAVWAQEIAGPVSAPMGIPSSMAGSAAAGVSQAAVFPAPGTFHGMAAAYKTIETNYLSAISAVMAVPSPERNFANTVQALSRANARYNDAELASDLIGAVSPDPKVRRMSDAIKRRISRVNIQLEDRQDIYQAYKDVAAKAEPLTGEDKRLRDEVLRGYERRGMGLSQVQRDRLNGIRNRLGDLMQAFDRNLREVNDNLELDSARLKEIGLPQGYIDGRERTSEGKVKITLDYPSYKPFMEVAKDSELRRQLYMKFENRAADKNMAVLTKVLNLRREMAGLLGYDSFARYDIADRMAKTPERVAAFLGRLKDLLAAPAQAEEARLLGEMRKERPEARSVPNWDRSYYMAKVQKLLYDFDDEEVRPYFPVDTVVEGTMKVYQNLLGVRFTEMPAQAWSPDVRLFQITDAADGRKIGYFFLDLYPRPGKFEHMAAFPIVEGRELPDGTYRQPVAAMVGNFTKATANQPSLLLHNEVETFFHEFGHLMHMTLTKARYGDFAGANVAQDFVEAPSQMLENFVWQPAVLAQLSGHWQDPSRKLPPELLAKMLKARDYNSAILTLRQGSLASLDLAYYTAVGRIDPMAIMDRVWTEVGVPQATPGTHFPANFGHLMDYAAAYYGYLWSLVYAQDIFSRFEKEGIDNPAVGMSYRKEILETGSSRDEAESLKAFLGREPNEEAFLRHLGLPTSEPKPGA